VVPDLAQCLGPTGPDARILALEVEAGLGVVALVVVFTLALLAEGVWISLVSGRTSAGSRVPGCETVSVRPAWSVVLARVRLLLAASDGVWHGDEAGQTLAHRVAAPVDVTPCVGSAGGGIAGVRGWGPHLQSGAASDGVWLGRVSLLTGTDWVALPVDVAPGVGSAGRGVAGVRPGLAPVVGADVALATVRVSLTLSAAARDGVRLGDVVREAATDRVPRPGDRALGVRTAGGGKAGVRLLDTSLALADVAGATVRVPDTLRTTTSDGVRLGDETGVTPTDGVPVEVDSTACPRTTRRRIAGIRLLHTSLVCTDESLLTVWVSDTLRTTASDRVRLGDQTGGTPADGVTGSGDRTDSSRTARIWVAWIGSRNTSLVLTDEALLTVWVPDTLRTTASDGVRLGDQTRSTSADGVSRSCD
jgi:hypothetical protein